VPEQEGVRLEEARTELARRIDPAVRPYVAAALVGNTPVLSLKLPGSFRACFTTRLGGASAGPYWSMNLDPRSEDHPDKVAGRRLVSPLQTHGLRVAGAAEYIERPPDTACDGITLHPDIDRGLAALLLFADCVPVVLCGEVDMAIAHGGWRGVLGGIVEQAGRAMIGPPATAVIGPSIGPCCFTVGQEVAAGFASRFGPQVLTGAEGAPRVDLWEAVSIALVELGVVRGQVVNPRLCTVCNADLFYSYRNESPVTGRHGCLAWVADTP
jgi:copper oxidase (laccase) domain-containing protein